METLIGEKPQFPHLVLPWDSLGCLGQEWVGSGQEATFFQTPLCETPKREPFHVTSGCGEEGPPPGGGEGGARGVEEGLILTGASSNLPSCFPAPGVSCPEPTAGPAGPAGPAPVARPEGHGLPAECSSDPLGRPAALGKVGQRLSPSRGLSPSKCLAWMSWSSPAWMGAVVERGWVTAKSLSVLNAFICTGFLLGYSNAKITDDGGMMPCQGCWWPSGDTTRSHIYILIGVFGTLRQMSD